jgi:hypothetical protein
MVVIKGNSKFQEITLVFLTHHANKIFWAYAFLLCFKHDRGAMRIVRTNKNTLVTTHFLKANPNVALNVFN